MIPMRKPRVRHAATILAAAVAISAAHVAPGAVPGAAAADTPRSVIQRTTGAVIEVLKEDSLSQEEKRSKIEKIVERETSFVTVSSLALARNWRLLSDRQREEFVQEFKKLLSVAYGRNLERYKDVRVEIVGDREEARGDWTVQTRILRPGQQDFAMSYRLRKEDGEWRIIDVVVEGASLVSNFRSQFQQIISNGGFERLLQTLREKNAAAAPLPS